MLVLLHPRGFTDIQKQENNTNNLNEEINNRCKTELIFVFEL